MYHVDNTVNGGRSSALCTVEGEIPSPATCVTVVETKVAVPEDTQPCNVCCFVEEAFLEEMNLFQKPVQRISTILDSSNRRKILAVTTQLKQLRKESLKKIQA